MLGELTGMLAPAVRAALGIVLIQSAIAKWQQPEAFARAFLGYPLLRRWPGVRGAAIVPLCELLLGVGLLFSDSVVGTVAAWGTVGFLALATAAIAVRGMHGERRFVCGCGSDFEREHGVVWLLGRNCGLVALLGAPAGGAGAMPAVLVGLAAVLTGRLVSASLAAVRMVKEEG